MGGKIIKTLKLIPAAWQVGIILVAIFLGGAAFSGFLSLPKDVEEIEAQVHQNTESIHEIRDQHNTERNLMLRMLCNQDPTETWESCERQYGGIGSS